MNLRTIILLCPIFHVLLIAQVNEENQVGRKAPNFLLENINGDFVELNDFAGKGPILLSFWSTCCKPCVEAVEAFSKLYEQYSDKGLSLLAISIDDERTVGRVKPYIKTKGYEFPVLLDTNSDVSRIYYAWLVPYTVLIDKNGTIIYSHLGYMRGDEIQVKTVIEQLMKN